MTKPLYTEFRKDGWPLCPRCGEDELWAHGPDIIPPYTPTQAEMIAAIRGCCNCSWTPPWELLFPSIPPSSLSGGGADGVQVGVVKQE